MDHRNHKNTSAKPPKWINQLLEAICDEAILEGIEGDLSELYQRRLERQTLRAANFGYFLDAIGFLRPFAWKKKEENHSINPLDMFTNYLKAAFRNFLNNKTYSFINLSGLVVGIVACLLIALHVLEELSYDKFHPASEHTYRVVMDMFNKKELSAKSAPTFAAVGPNLVIDFPEVLEATRILPFGNGVYSVKKEDGSLVRFNEEQAVFADPNFFKMMGFKLLKGNPEKVLKEKNQAVLSSSTAKRYFGDQNPIGQTITYRGVEEAVITGVMEDFPENSHMKFDIISSLVSSDGYEEWPQNWGWYDFYTYIRVNENADIATLKRKMAGYLDEKKAEAYAERGSREILELQNIGAVHLYSKGYSWEMGENGGAEKIYFLGAIALLILIIAWVNFINLSTARAVKRAKEVGVRKVVGATKSNLVNQFLIEAFLYNAGAISLGFLLVLLSIPFINQSLDISLETSLLLSPEILTGLLALIILGTIISGLYPAFVLTKFKPINVLKGSFYNRKSSFGFRQVLVVFQFTVSTILILGTVMVAKQLNYMLSQDLGLNVAQTLVLKAPTSSRGGNDLEERQKIFSNKLLPLTGVKGFTMSNIVPGLENFSISGFHTRATNNERKNCYRVSVDEHYFPDFDIKIVEGRNFEKGLVTDTNAVVLNREATKLLGFVSPATAIGKILNPGNNYEWRIVGVAEDYHHSSLKEALDPIIFSYRPDRGNYLSIKLVDQDYTQTMASIEHVWEEVYPDNPFDFFFLDDHFNRQYKSDNQFNAVFTGFAGIAIFVAFLGLFGLVSFTVEQSRKEIGIRKILGASTPRLVLLFAKDYAWLVILSILIAFPLGYYLMDLWLADFAYRTNIGFPVFIFGGIAIALITFFTVSIKSLAAANANPIEALRE